MDKNLMKLYEDFLCAFCKKRIPVGEEWKREKCAMISGRPRVLMKYYHQECYEKPRPKYLRGRE